LCFKYSSIVGLLAKRRRNLRKLAFALFLQLKQPLEDALGPVLPNEGFEDAPGESIGGHLPEESV